MKLIKQINRTTCGQACIAMIKNISIEQAIELIGHDGITSDEEILKIFPVGSRFILGPTPVNILTIQKHKEPNGNREHWTVSCYGQTFDPAKIGPKLWPSYKFLLIKNN